MLRVSFQRHSQHGTGRRNGGMKTAYRKYLRIAADTVLPLFYPRRCPVCQEIVTPPGALICPACRLRVSFLEEPLCKKCGRELPYSEEEICGTCRRHPRSYEAGVSLMRYDAVGQASMKAFKYQGRQEYAAWYAAELAARYGSFLRTRGADALIPVPVHKSRLRQRGYNQAEVLARELSRFLEIPVRGDILLRTKKTTAQKGLGAGERQKNLLASMTVKDLPQDVRRIILVDDIYTTGSTAEACTRALRRVGAEGVWVATVCMVEE